ncbi:MAG: lytic transglycosylase domain-containing protein [Acidimicrobiales bacterium]
MADSRLRARNLIACLALVIIVLLAFDSAVLIDHGIRPTAVAAAPATLPAPAARPSAGPAAILGPSPLARWVATDPAGLAAQLAATETAIRDPSIPVVELPELGQLEQLDYGSLTAHPAWQAPVLTRLPPGLRATAGLVLDAGRQLDALDAGSPPSDRLPPWRIIAPLPASALLADYNTASAATGVPWTYLAAINLVETRMGRIRGDSSAGAQGPMQFIPSTWVIYGAGGDINAPGDAVAAAARLLAANGAPADMARALYHYNPSQHYVEAVTDYATVMAANSRAFLGFYEWQVFVSTLHGDVLLPVGYPGPVQSGVIRPTAR